MNSKLPLSTLILSHWKFIALMTIVGGGVAFAVSKIVPKKYTSYAEVYATSSNSLDDAISRPEFGYEIHSDRLIQLLESQRIKDSVISEFDLINYYDLDPSKNTILSDAYKELSEDLTFSRNPKMAVIIKAETKDPELSAKMVNYIIDIIDPVNESILKSNAYKAVDHYRTHLSEAQHRVDSLISIIYSIEIDSNKVDKLSTSRVLRLQDEFMNPNNPIRTTLARISQYPLSRDDEATINNYIFELGQLNHFKSKLAEAKNSIEAPTPSIHVISRAKPLFKPSYPNTIVNTLLGLVFGLISSLLIIVARLKIKEIKAIS